MSVAKKVLLCRWIEDSLAAGEKASEDMHGLKLDSEKSPNRSEEEEVEVELEEKVKEEEQEEKDGRDIKEIASCAVNAVESNYNPPDFNADITHIFGKLVDIYRGKSIRFKP